MSLDVPSVDSDAAFFDILDGVLKDKSDGATEQLAVLYQCIGLGFTGGERPETLRKRMVEISGRLRGSMDAAGDALVCPEAYENVDTSDLIEPPGRSLVGIGIGFVGLIVVLVGATAYLYVSNSSALTSSLETIIEASADDAADGSGDAS
ncbi:MAG: hypothetical protein AAF747_04955, partial [Planctomycetota bacterium]